MTIRRAEAHDPMARWRRLEAYVPRRGAAAPGLLAGRADRADPAGRAAPPIEAGAGAGPRPGVTRTAAGWRTPTGTTARDARARHLAGENLRAAQLHGELTRATRTLRDNFDVFAGGDGHITTDDLRRIRDSRDPSVTQEMRDRARYLLDHPIARNALDVGAGSGDVDGKISRDDLDGASAELRGIDWSGPTIGVSGTIDSTGEARATFERYRFLTDTAAGKGGRNGHFSNDDIDALLEDDSLPEDLRAAAVYVRDHDVDLGGDGSSLWGTVTSPIRGGADWLGDRGGDLLETGREVVLAPASLDREERAELDAAAEAAAGRDASAAQLPLNEQHNAHRTNTREEMLAALQGDYPWMEGDVRRDPPIMAHDWQQSDGMSLTEWLEIGAASGRGLKLDLKEGASVDGVIDAVRASGIPQDRLILNADVMAGPGGSGRNVSPEDLHRLRAAFPDATIAIGAVTGPTAPGTTYTEAQIGDMVALAESIGGPVMFPLRAELVTPEIVERLSAHGTVAIWSSASSYPLADSAAAEAAAERFRDMGVTGLIDLAISS